ncbi:MAG: hypothetical protein AVDCRST_MAG79-2587, partial [uncultured Thermoleophilia bacterium]
GGVLRAAVPRAVPVPDAVADRRAGAAERAVVPRRGARAGATRAVGRRADRARREHPPERPFLRRDRVRRPALELPRLPVGDRVRAEHRLRRAEPSVGAPESPHGRPRRPRPLRALRLTGRDHVGPAPQPGRRRGAQRGGAAVRGVLGGGLVRVPDRGVPPAAEHARVDPGGGAGRRRRDGRVPAVVPGPPALPRLL